MPLLGMLHLLIAVGFAVHAMRTGRPQFWMYILIFVPLVGSIAYILFELIPEMANTRRARRVTGSLGDLVDPDREWRRRAEEASRTDSVKAKMSLAEECERKGMWQEAISLYTAAATGIYAEDAGLLSGLARSQLEAGQAQDALSTLERLRHSHPKSVLPEAHLVNARALEMQGRLDEAEQDYLALVGYNTGIEARVRFGLLMLRSGEPKKARTLFQDVIRTAESRKLPLSDAERDWVKVAKANV